MSTSVNSLFDIQQNIESSLLYELGVFRDLFYFLKLRDRYTSIKNISFEF